MTYGSMHDTTRVYLIERAKQSNITLDKLGLDPDLSFEEAPGDEVAIPDNLYQISVIYGGALDEEFYVQTIYEVNIADWLAEQCSLESQKNYELSVRAGIEHDDSSLVAPAPESWEVIVQEYAYEDAGPVHYRVTDEASKEAGQ